MQWLSPAAISLSPRLSGRAASDGRQVALNIERVVHRRMHREKALHGPRRSEALHLALASSHHLVPILGAVVLAEALLMAR